MPLPALQHMAQLVAQVCPRLVWFEALNRLHLESLVGTQLIARLLFLAAQPQRKKPLHSPSLTGIGLSVLIYLLRPRVITK